MERNVSLVASSLESLGTTSVVTEAEFAAWIRQAAGTLLEEPTVPVALGVSGGADSMALAFLARRWRSNVTAFVVDHGLRAESAQEARQTCARLAAMKVTAQLITLSGLGTERLQERARTARLDALEAAAAHLGARVLLLGHHAADQEETLWMRQERESGPEGLRGIASSALRGRIAIVRPLLAASPARLRATLLAEALPWCEDPSNRNRRFHRVRARQDLQPEQRRALREVQLNAERTGARDDEQVVSLLARTCTWQPEGWVHLAPEALSLQVSASADQLESVHQPESEKKRIAALLLRRLVRLVGGGNYLPSLKETRALLERGAGTLGGACLSRSQKKEAPGWRLVRERRVFPAAVPARPGILWGERWRYLGADPKAMGLEFSNLELSPEISIAALGVRWAARFRSGRCVPLQALAALPALWKNDAPIGLAAGARGLSADLPRVSFVWESGLPVSGARLGRENF